ncbi:MAG: glycosyltransferase 61 family protein [Granulosicoccaceae bacterium]
MNSIAQQPSPVHVGKDGWLFLIAGSNNVLDLYRDDSSFSDKLARQWVELIQTRDETLQAMDVQYVHLPAPEKLTVLHKFYDGDIENIHSSPIHQLAAKYGAEIPAFINPLPYLSRHIDGPPIYWKTDTHWSCWGCFAAYQLLCSEMQIPTNRELLQYPYDEGQVMFDLGGKLATPDRETGRFYKLAKNAKRVFANGMVQFKEQENQLNEIHLHVGSHVIYRNDSPDAVKQRLVLFGDSFSEYRPHLLTGMLAETFQEVHFIWNSNIDYDYVKRVKADIVITELAERFMTTVPTDKLDIESFSEKTLTKFLENQNMSFTPEFETRFVEPCARLSGKADLKPRLRVVEGGAKKNKLSENVSNPSAKQPIKKKFEIKPTTSQVVLPKEAYHCAPPQMVQKIPTDVVRDETLDIRAVRVTEVYNAKVFFTGIKALVIEADGNQLSRHRVSDEEAKELPWNSYTPLPGTTVLFALSAGAHCYYHWMLDILPKLGVLQKAGFKLADIDNLLVRQASSSFQKDTLMHFGFESNRIVETKDNNRLLCEKVIIVDIQNGINMKMNRFLPAWLKHSFPVPIEPKVERIKLYVSRPKGVRRGVENEDELLPILERYGYTVLAMEGMSVSAQAAIMAKADVLVSPHGGALTNMVFCRPGIDIIELHGRHVYPYYYGLAQLCGHNYHATLENMDDYTRLVSHDVAHAAGSGGHQKQTCASSFIVDIELFEAALKKVD